MGALAFEPGDYVAHPDYGACRVVEMGGVTVGGVTFDALTIAPLASQTAVVRIPLAKVRGSHLRVVSREEAEAMPTPEERADHHWRSKASRYGLRGAKGHALKRRMERLIAATPLRT